MEAYNRPLKELFEAVGRFVRHPEVRLLHVEVHRDLRESAVDLAMGLEYHADNRSPFVRLEGAHDKNNRIAAEWMRAMREQHGQRREAMAKEGYALPPLAPAPPADDPRAAFAITLGQLLSARCEPLRGVVVVLAPTHIEDPARFDADLASWLAPPELRAARFLVVEPQGCSLGPRTQERAGTFWRVRIDLSQDEVRAEVGRRVDAAASAPIDAPGPAQVGAAWPPGAAPPRRNAPARLSEEQAAALAAELGVPVGLFGSGVRELRPLILKGARALSGGDPMRGVGFMRQAVQRASAAGLHREAMLLSIVSATFLVQAGERDVAEGSFRGSAELAKESGWYDLAAQALMAAAALRLIARDENGASVAYAWAGQAARHGGFKALAIEGFRMAAELAARIGNRDSATRLWTEAVTLGGSLEPAQARQTSAALAARQLAAHVRKLGDPERAVTLEAQAQLMG